MSSEPARDTDEVAAPRAGDDLPVFSERLSTILEDMVKGEAPNAGRFCGNCYTPIDPQRLQCAQCGQPVEKRPPVQRVPDEVLLMCRSKRRRESLVVNGFAYAGLLLAVVIFIGAFSLPVLFDQQEIPEGDVRIKVTGFQWYWGYEYVDEEVAFESFMIGAGMGNLNEEILAELNEAGYGADEFKLATDTAVVVPVGATVVMDVTGADVIHSWTIPAFGVKQDAVPGRIAQLWFEAEQEGVYFGQCSELCGKDHAYMPITVKVVSPEAYEQWLAGAKEEFPA